MANTPGARTCVESCKHDIFAGGRTIIFTCFPKSFSTLPQDQSEGPIFRASWLQFNSRCDDYFHRNCQSNVQAFSLPQVQFERCGFFALDRKATKNYALLPSFVKLLSPTHCSRLQRKEAAWSLTAQSHKGARCSRSVPLEYCSASLKAKIDKNRSDFGKPKKGRAKETKKKATAPCPALGITEVVLNSNRLC